MNPFAMLGIMKRLESAHPKAAAFVRNELMTGLPEGTILEIDDKILGKPADVDEAYGMLCMLAGRTHSVYTGVTLIFPQGADGQERDMETFHVKTDVKMYDSDKQILREYAKSGEPLDKAGAYGIQGRGAILVEKIDGDYSNVKGLPVAEIYRRLYHNFPSSGQAISTTFSII
ncbi:MAG: Maf family protein [Lachnospiraceae bacterium]|nr:Maf family protein [Lachnospiraceae bacterium]